VAIGSIPGTYGPGGTGFTPRPLRTDGATAGSTPAAAREPAPAAPAQTNGVHGADADTIPMQAPPDIDPALWSVLTADERRFFSRLQTAGPLTYGPNSANVPPGLVRGVRIDRTV
jgi:hypothetical protein